MASRASPVVLFSGRLPRAMVDGSSSISRTKIFDAHLHVWASEEEARKFPYFPGQEPTLPGNVEVLLQEMSAADIDGALIVQPINHKFDHSYVTSVLQKYPEKFVGCCLANPVQTGEGVAELEQLVTQDGYKAVRFNPYLWPSGRKMNDEIGSALFAKAGQLGVPVGFMCFKGLSLHIGDIESLCCEYPSTKVLLDHFGFCKPPQSQEENAAWNSLLHLARLPQVYVKVSAQFRVSRESFPYRDTWPMLRALLDTFGASRLMWGSDFPYVTEQCGYMNAARVLREARHECTIPEADFEWLMGKTARQLLHF